MTDIFSNLKSIEARLLKADTIASVAYVQVRIHGELQ